MADKKLFILLDTLYDWFEFTYTAWNPTMADIKLFTLLDILYNWLEFTLTAWKQKMYFLFIEEQALHS